MNMHQRQSPPRRLKAVAIPQPRLDERMVAWIHLLLALLIPFLVCTLTGCAPKIDTSVDYGAEVESSKVTEALNGLVRDSDPSLTKKGAFVHFATYQRIGGNYTAVISDTGHTVIDRTEVDPYVSFDVREIQFNYKQDGSEPEKLVRDFQMTFVNSQAATAATRLASVMPTGKAGENTPIRPAESKQTYHNLKTWEAVAPAPEAVRKATNCLGIPDCKITYRHMEFDLVFWDDPKGERLHVELVTSPDVPQTIGYNMSRINDYIPGLVKSCLTQMVAIGDSGSKTLFTECQEVVNFRFESEPSSSESLMRSLK